MRFVFIRIYDRNGTIVYSSEIIFVAIFNP